MQMDEEEEGHVEPVRDGREVRLILFLYALTCSVREVKI